MRWKTNVGPASLGCGHNISQPPPLFEVWPPSPAPAGYSSSEMGAWRPQPLTDYTRGQVHGVMDDPRGWGWRPQVCASPGWTRVIWPAAGGIFSERGTRRKQCRPLANVASTITRCYLQAQPADT